ncbi:MAG: ATP synthase F1 subunit epsilon [Planctomycetota bacterium]|nr:ATP synthase F1 subunit epsilon [Planctomycetota bacterium]
MARPEDRKAFACEILTPEGCFWRGQTVGVVFPASDGQMGIWAGHAPLAAMIGAGPIIVEEPTGQTVACFVVGGFARVQDNQCTLLAEECTPVDRLSPEKALAEFDKAKAAPGATADEAARREWLLTAARRKLYAARAVAG